jgi:hypothetical protein
MCILGTLMSTLNLGHRGFHVCIIPRHVFPLDLSLKSLVAEADAMPFLMSFFRNFATLSFVLNVPDLAFAQFPSSPISSLSENGQTAATFPEVNTTSGVVVGHGAPKLPQVGRYLGIPFGLSTEGEARWMSPKRYYGTGKIDKTNFVGALE